jgi:hypothetical protein
MTPIWQYRHPTEKVALTATMAISKTDVSTISTLLQIIRKHHFTRLQEEEEAEKTVQGHTPTSSGW